MQFETLTLCRACMTEPVMKAGADEMFWCRHTGTLYGRNLDTGATCAHNPVTPDELVNLAHQFEVFHTAKSGRANEYAQKQQDLPAQVASERPWR